MRRWLTALAVSVVVVTLAPTAAFAKQGAGGETASDSAGGGAQIGTWVIGAINGGVKRPVGTTTCTPWVPLSGSTTELINENVSLINPATGQLSAVYTRSCDGKFQYV